MTEIAYPIIGGILGFCLCIVWQRHGWRVGNLIRQNLPTRCDKCGTYCLYRNTQSAQRTTGQWVNLCEDCFADEYYPRTKRDPQT